MTEVQARAYTLAGNKGTDRSMQDGAAAGSMLELQTTHSNGIAELGQTFILFQRIEGVLQDRADVRGVPGIEHARVEKKIESGHVCAEDFDLLAFGPESAFDHIRNNLSADALHVKGRKRLRDKNVARESIGLVADD